MLIDPSPELQSYVQALARRADAVRGRMVTPEEDNMLKVTTDGRKAALDTRLVTGQKASTPGKLDHAADTIARLWREHRDQIYRTPSGDPSPITGALQIVFCDLSTPNPDRWNAYDELRQLLAARGLPAEQVRFIHEARNDAEKARLFAACRAGHVSVLVGSTEKMGVGTNIQDRCIAIHHLDCPWRPADIEQRDGRGVRQGNQNPEIHIIRYATQGSFDTYSWQTVERKARFINQVMRGRLDVREIEDIGENTLSFAEVKALASGDPLILDKAKIDAEVTRLHRLERAWQRAQHTLKGTIAGAEDRARSLAEQINTVRAAAAQRTDTRGDLFRMTVNGRAVTSRTDAAQLLAGRAAAAPLRAARPDRRARRPARRRRDHRRHQRPPGRPAHAPRPPGRASDARARPARRLRPVARAPARASRRHPARARRPPPGRPRRRPARARHRPRAARPPVQVRRRAHRRPRPPAADPRADQHPPRAEPAARTDTDGGGGSGARHPCRGVSERPERAAADRHARGGPVSSPVAAAGARTRPRAIGRSGWGRDAPDGAGVLQRGLGDLDHDRLLQQLLDERAQLGGVIEQARPRMRHPGESAEDLLLEACRTAGRQSHVRDRRLPRQVGDVGGDQRQRMSLQDP